MCIVLENEILIYTFFVNFYFFPKNNGKIYIEMHRREKIYYSQLRDIMRHVGSDRVLDECNHLPSFSENGF